MIERLVAAVARVELGHALRFEPGGDELPGPDGRALPVYLHVPAVGEALDERRTRAGHVALRREMKLYGEAGWRFVAAVLGGGAPTALPDELEHTVETARELFGVRSVTVRTGPDQLTRPRLEALGRARVSRLEVEVPTFDDGLLRRLGRHERLGPARAVVDRLRAVQGRFTALGVTMAFNLPGQDDAALGRDLDTLLDLGPNEVCYRPFAAGALPEVRRYRQVVARLEPRYRPVTGWRFVREPAALDGVGWRDEWAGLGSGALGLLGGTLYANAVDPDDYAARLARGRPAIDRVHRLSQRELVRRAFAVGLFSGRLDPAELQQRHGGFGRHLWFDLALLRLAGALRNDGRELVLTGRGRYYWVVLMLEFLRAVNDLRQPGTGTQVRTP